MPVVNRERILSPPRRARIAIVGANVNGRAQGKLVPTGQVKLVQPSETGIVRAIYVENGRRVAAGEVLIELDPTNADADSDRLRADHVAAELRVARLTALLTDMADPWPHFVPPDGARDAQIIVQHDLMRAQADEYAARLVELDRRGEQYAAQLAGAGKNVAALEQSVPLLTERVAAYRQLADKAYVARTTYLAIEQERVDKAGELSTARHRLNEAKAALAGAKAERCRVAREVRGGLLDELADAEAAAETARQELIKADRRQGLQALTAPVDGIVQQLKVHTKGGIVTAADPLMVIVPADRRLTVEASVLNRDVGFVEAGQSVEVKLETFPFTRYGTIDGTILHVSRDAIEDEKQGLVYAARVALDRQDISVDGRAVPLAPGMAATVEIRTGDRPIVEFLLAPLFRYRDESLRER